MAMPFDTIFKRTIQLDIEQDKVVALMGPPGIGKSSFIKSLAKERGAKMFTVACNQMAEKSDLNGARTVPVTLTRTDGTMETDYVQRFFPHEAIASALNEAEANPDTDVYLVLEEVNRTDEGVTSGVLTMVTDRMVGHRSIPANVHIIVAGNIKGNVNALDDASISRFVLYQVAADAEVLIEIMGQRMNPWVKEVLEENPELVYCTPAEKDKDTSDISSGLDFLDSEAMVQFTTPRTIESVSDWLNAVTAKDYDLLAVMNQQRIAIEDKPNTSDAEQISRLNATLIAHTGDTRFTQKLLVKVTEALVSQSGPKPSTARVTGLNTTLSEPADYQSLVNLGTRRELENAIIAMDPQTCSENFAYALYDVVNRTALIDAFAGLNIELTNETQRTLLGVASDLNQDNVDALMKLPCRARDCLNTML